MEDRHTFQRDPCDEYAWQEAELRAVETLKVFAFYFQKPLLWWSFEKERESPKCLIETSHASLSRVTNAGYLSRSS
jgi:hypothetical protein